MTEAEWLGCDDPTPMLQFVRGKVSDRKLRLFAVGCCRRMWHLLTDNRSRRAVEVAELFAEKLVGEGELVAAFDPADETADAAMFHSMSFAPDDVSGPITDDPASVTAAAISSAASCARFAAISPEKLARITIANRGVVSHVACQSSWAISVATGYPDPALPESAEQTNQAHMLLDILGNPFRLVAVDPAWLTSSVVGLACTIYDNRDFDRLPVLSDALEEAGCHDADILAHCRQPGEHVRGCWVVDLLLGKE